MTFLNRRRALAFLNRRRSLGAQFVAILTIFSVVGPMIPRRSFADTAPVAPGSLLEGQTGLGSAESGGATVGGALATAAIDPHTGVLQSSYPFALPKARGDAQPMLALSYSSASGLGVAGQGWDLVMPSIERHNLSGAPTFDDVAPYGPGMLGPFDATKQDRFTFGGVGLVPICSTPIVPGASGGTCSSLPNGEQMPAWAAAGWVYYRLEKEDGSLMRFFWSGTGRQWKVIGKSGVTLEFGVPSDDPSDKGGIDVNAAVAGSEGVFRYNLVRQYDTHRTASGRPTNLVRYVWTQFSNNQTVPLTGSAVPRGFLTDVFDTPPTTDAPAATSSFAHHAHLSYIGSANSPGGPNEYPGADTPVAQSPIWKLRPMMRLDGVDVTSNDFAGGTGRRQVRRYHLSYDYAGSDYQNYRKSNFQLHTIVMEGTTADPASRPSEDPSTQLLGQTSCTTFPPTTFTYSVAAVTPTYTTIGTVPQVAPLENPGKHIPTLIDANGDGLTDIIGSRQAGPMGVITNVLYLNSVHATAGSWPQSEMVYQGAPTLGEWAMAPSVPFNTGSFLPDGKLDVLWFGPYGLAATTNAVQYEILDARPLSVGWAWSVQAQGAINLYQLPTAAPPIWPGGGTGIMVADEEKYTNVDVDGDGLTDLMTTALYSVTGSLPTGERLLGGRFTTKSLDGITHPFARDPGTGAMHPPGDPPGVFIPQPQFCVGGANNPDDLFGTNVYGYSHADYNGDGIADWIRLEADGDVSLWVGHGDGIFGICPDTSLNCSCDVAGRQVVVSGTAIPNLKNGMFDDVTGDGLADLIVPSPDGTSLMLYPNRFDTEHLDWVGNLGLKIPLTSAPGFSPNNAPLGLLFADMDGSGTDDIVVVVGSWVGYIDVTGGLLPGLLTSIENGIGGKTDITYDTIPNLDDQARAGGAATAWQTHSPQALHVVTSITVSDGLATKLSGDVMKTLYGYEDPIFDPRDRTFVGFRTVNQATLGDGTEPDSWVKTTYWTCSGDLVFVGACDGKADYVLRSLRGLPILTEVYDGASRYLSTTHRSFVESQLYQGLDGRAVHLVMPQRVDTYAYDNGPFSGAGTYYSSGPPGLTWSNGSSSWHSGETFWLRSSNYAHSVVTMAADAFGNINETDDYGYVNAKGQPVDAVAIQHLATWSIQPDVDGTHWTWRVQKSTTQGMAFGTTVSVNRDFAHVQSFAYDNQGNATDIFGELAGTLPLQRSNENGAQFASSPATQSPPKNAALKMTHLVYDSAGTGNVVQVQQPNGRCTDIGFDTNFDALPTVRKVYTGGCGSSALVTIVRYDGVIGQESSVWGPDGQKTDFTHDEFGRLASIAKPDPVLVGQTMTDNQGHGAVQIVTDELSTGERVHTTVTDLTNPSQKTESYTYTDGLGRPLIALKTGDAGAWILSPRAVRSPKGHVIQSFPPVPYSDTANPPNPPLTFGTGTSRQVHYDAFGRALQSWDGPTQTGAFVYHGDSYETRDGEQMLTSGNHAGAYKRIDLDGHGRTIQVTTYSTSRTVTTSVDYAPTGEVKDVTRIAPEGTYVRWMQYDSLGRMVLNAEPNTSVGFTTNQIQASGMKAWRYAYDDAGDLVGTSDARGCGKNLLYDGAGRLQSEDYSPCLAAQGPYTPPSTTNAWQGTEVWRNYEHLTGGIDSGRLLSVYDRGQRSEFAYDGRGRVKEVDKYIARPGRDPSDLLRYEPTASIKNFIYDDGDRVVSETTGADVADLWGQDAALVAANGQSAVTSTYSPRGTLQSVQGSYGTLVAQNALYADGRPHTTTYGDAAGTTATYTYDIQNRVHEFTLARTAPAFWSSSPSPTYPVSTELGTRATVLADDVYTYDNANNPTLISDQRAITAKAMEWPAGALPSDRSAQYDDDYRLKSIVYSAADSFVSQAPLPSQAVAPMPMSTAAARVQQQTFAYDGLGNMTGSTDDANLFFDRSLGSTAHAGTGPNQLTSAWNLRSQTVGSTVYNRTGKLDAQYDAAGNLTVLRLARAGGCDDGACQQTFFYDWDEVGRLARARRWDFSPNYVCTGGSCDPTNSPFNTAPTAAPSFAPTADVQYVYDGGGQRVLRASTKTIDFSAATLLTPACGDFCPPPPPVVVTSYTAEIFPSLRLEGAAWNVTTGTYQRDVTTEAVSLVANGASYARVVSDGTLPTLKAGTKQHVFLELGATVIDQETSEVVERTTYQAYGAPDSEFRAARWKTFRDPYKYTGKEDDVEIGLTYFGARYYSAQLDRWISADPLTIHGLGADLNPYAFVRGSPLRFVDLTGLDESSPAPIPGYFEAYVTVMFINWLGSQISPPKPVNAMHELPPPQRPPAPAPGGGGGGASAPANASVPATPVPKAAFDPWAVASKVAMTNPSNAALVEFGKNVLNTFDDNASNAEQLRSAILAAGNFLPDEEIAAEAVQLADYTVEELVAMSRANVPAEEFTFRGDSRSPDIIFSDGFQPRGDSTDLMAHALDNTSPPSAFVATSKSYDVAAGFADRVYVVRPVGGLDVNAVLGPASPFPHELEVAVPGGISPSNVRAVTIPPEGVSWLNPGWAQ